MATKTLTYYTENTTFIINLMHRSNSPLLPTLARPQPEEGQPIFGGHEEVVTARFS
jgi:hypothetical protein